MDESQQPVRTDAWRKLLAVAVVLVAVGIATKLHVLTIVGGVLALAGLVGYAVKN